MAKNRLVSLCTSWSLRYPPCLISLITNKLAANSVTIADFIVIPTCFLSRREVEKWSTLRTRFFFLFAEGLSDLFSFAKLMIIDELELQGSMGLKTTPSRFETKVPWVPSLVLYSTLTQFFFLGCSTLSTRTYLLVTQEWKKQLVFAMNGFVYVAFIFQGSYSLINIAT